MVTPGLISIRTPAKINLFLHVLERQADGYHQIFSLMQMVGLYDQIDLRRTRDHRRIEILYSGLTIPKSRENLVIRAAKAFMKRYEVKQGIEISLHKRIPISAGLGGGSSDAAGTLKGLFELWGIRPKEKDLMVMARSIGSDVPFFFSGSSALVQGTGEEIQAIRTVGEAWVVLVNPGIAVSTAWAYRKLDEIRGGVTPRGLRRKEKFGLTSAKNRNKISADSGLTFQLGQSSPYLHNDLEEATIPLYPVIGKVKKHLHRHGAQGILMSGSGPTVFGLFPHPNRARRAARALRQEHSDWEVWAVKVLRQKPYSIRRSSNG